jgi:hypothetical protein
MRALQFGELYINVLAKANLILFFVKRAKARSY